MEESVGRRGLGSGERMGAAGSSRPQATSQRSRAAEPLLRTHRARSTAASTNGT